MPIPVLTGGSGNLPRLDSPAAGLLSCRTQKTKAHRNPHADSYSHCPRLARRSRAARGRDGGSCRPRASSCARLAGCVGHPCRTRAHWKPPLPPIPTARIYPFFMAEGFFTRTTLPRRLAAAGHAHLTQLGAFGTDPAMPDLIAGIVLQACQRTRADTRRDHPAPCCPWQSGQPRLGQHHPSCGRGRPRRRAFSTT